jgi:Xaa-Pro aminopeptidase
VTHMIKTNIGKRLLKLREEMGTDNIDAVLVSKRENYVYMSGFTGTAAVLLITVREALLITDFRYIEQASEQATLYEIVQYSGNLQDAIGNLLINKNIKRLGFESANTTYDKYNEFKTKFHNIELVPVYNLIEKLRIIKETEEIEIIKAAVKIADEAFTYILGFIKPGIMEIEIAAEIEYFMKKHGAKGASFEIIAASGLRSSMPHGTATQKKVCLGDVITLDFGAIFDEYCSDITRTVFLGNPEAELIKIYNIVLEAQKVALEGAIAGLQGKEIDSIARNVIDEYGFGKYFGHGLGHGVGLEIHEEPRLSPTGNTVLKNGMAVTVEPGIYVGGIGGVRIEDMIIINGRAPIILTNSPKEAIIL